MRFKNEGYRGSKVRGGGGVHINTILKWHVKTLLNLFLVVIYYCNTVTVYAS